MTFSDKLIALRKKAGWSQEELAERLNVSRQSVSKWESAQSMPDIDKILQLSSLFSETTDCLLKDGQDDPQPAAAQTPSPLPRVTLTQAEDYLTRAQANAPQMALATALCIVRMAERMKKDGFFRPLSSEDQETIAKGYLYIRGRFQYYVLIFKNKRVEVITESTRGMDEVDMQYWKEDISDYMRKYDPKMEETLITKY